MIVHQNLIVLDIESGGFIPSQNPLTQIAFKIIDNITFEEKASFVSLIKPYDEKLYISKGAMQLNGITKELCEKKGKPLKEVLDEVCEIWKSAKISYYQPILVGHNISFDQMFLQYVFDFCYGNGTGKNGLCKLYDYIQLSSIDTMQLARMVWINNELPNFKLETIGEFLGTINSNEHQADADVDQTVAVVKNLILRMRGGTPEQIKKTEEKQKFNFQF